MLPYSWSILVVIMAVVCTASENNLSNVCDHELDICLGKEKCRKTLSSVLDDKCKDLFSNLNYFTSESSKIACTRTCRTALKKSKRGVLNRLLNCRSNTSEYFPYQDRALRCMTGKISEEPHDNYIKNGCSYVFKQCTDHAYCRRRYEEMMFKCKGMLMGSRCTNQCEIALQGFLTAKKTIGFFQCQCDGAFYFQKTCHALKQNIMTSCSSKHFQEFVKSRLVIRKW